MSVIDNFWTKIDKDNPPKGKVLLGNFHKESLEFGAIYFSELMFFMQLPMCYSEQKYVTHYHDVLKHPKP